MVEKNILEENRKLYKDFLRLNQSREDALNLILVRMELKDATTVGFNKELASVLKKNGYIYELDESYLTKRIHGFLEYTSKTPLPGAEIVRRLYVGKRISRQRLKQLKSGSNFEQGLLFGFPICDVINFCRKAKREDKRFLEIFKDWLAEIPSRDGLKYVDFRLMGGIVKYFSPIRVIEHVPCLGNCLASLELTERNLDILEQLDPSFKKFAVEEFKKPILLYGNKWEDLGLMRFAELKRKDSDEYAARCSSALPLKIPSNAQLRIRLTPRRKVEVWLNGKKIIKQESKRPIRWSYCFIFPYDSMGETANNT
jgi:hypothetical protein